MLLFNEGPLSKRGHVCPQGRTQDRHFWATFSQMPQRSHHPQILSHECCPFTAGDNMTVTDQDCMVCVCVCVCVAALSTSICIASVVRRPVTHRPLGIPTIPVFCTHLLLQSTVSDICFTDMRLFAIIMFLIHSVLAYVRAGYGLPLHVKWRIFSCPPLSYVFCAKLPYVLQSAVSSP
jgi:hypothetical protein